MLGTHLENLAWYDRFQDVEKIRNQGLKIRMSVALGHEDDHRDRECAHVMLNGEVAIDGEKHVELVLSDGEEIAVPPTGPAHLRNRASLMPD